MTLINSSMFEFSHNISMCDGVHGLRALPDDSMPMTLTSPPYDSVRVYGGNTWNFETFRAMADALYRVTMPGGVVVWVVQDAIEDGGESGTSDLQRVYLRSLGFKLYQTLYIVAGSFRPSARRYYRQTSLALVFSKGRPETVNLLADRENSTAGHLNRMSHRRRDGSLERRAPRVVRDFGVRSDTWHYPVGRGTSTKDYYAFGHPALMPEDLARDLILSFSRPGDLVLDPMCGSGTTCKMALLNNRRYLGFEIHEPYHELAVRRLADAESEYRRRLDSWLVA